MKKIILLSVNQFDRIDDANMLEDSIITRTKKEDDFDAVLSRINEFRNELGDEEISPESANGNILVYDMSEFMENWNDTDDDATYLYPMEFWMTYATII
jgi:hypothetical protein